MSRKKIAILSGGNTEERVISELSAQTVFNYLDPALWEGRIIDINKAAWTDLLSGVTLDKNDFSFILENEKWRPDVVFCAIHGSPLEDGLLQGYFDTIGIPYTCCDGFSSALTMNKYMTKQVLKAAAIPMAKEILLNRESTINISTIVDDLHLPMFIKPNKHGSSFGVSKVKNAIDIATAIEHAFKFDDEVLCESYLNGREFGNGVYLFNGEINIMPVTEIISKNEFFDYAAKYEGEVSEVTPANISPELTQKIQSYSSRIFKHLGLKGFVRIDYILMNNEFYLLEVNTVPGLSPTSIIPQQAIASGLSLQDFFSWIIQESLNY